MIPKVIHYFWFGSNPKPYSVKKCIASWRKYCPDYKIIEWNEKNCPVKDNLYYKQAYDVGKYGFAVDYPRLWIVYNYGGIYLDTDVEIVKSWDPLLNHDFFVGRQQGFQINMGSGFGAVKGHPLLKHMMDDYENIPFIKENGEYDMWTSPHRNSQWLFANGLRKDDSYQEIEGAVIYPIEYFSPKDAWSRITVKTKNTYSIHHCDGTWNPRETRSEHFRRYTVNLTKNALDYIVHIPNRIMYRILGKEKYTKLKRTIKGGN